MSGYTYAEKPEAPPKGHWRSFYGGYERTPFAGFACGATITAFDIDLSPDARRRRVRERRREKLRNDFTAAELAEALARLESEWSRLTEDQMHKEFHNG